MGEWAKAADHHLSRETILTLLCLHFYHFNFSSRTDEQWPGSLDVPMVTCLSTTGMCKQHNLSQQFSPCLPPPLWASRSPYAGRGGNTPLRSVSERTKATLAGLYLSWTCAKHRPWKISEGQREGGRRRCGSANTPQTKSAGTKSGLSPKRQSKTSRQAMKSSEHHLLQRPRLPTVINCTTLGKHTG